HPDRVAEGNVSILGSASVAAGIQNPGADRRLDRGRAGRHRLLAEMGRINTLRSMMRKTGERWIPRWFQQVPPLVARESWEACLSAAPGRQSVRKSVANGSSKTGCAVRICTKSSSK